MKVKAPFKIHRSWFGDLTVLCYGLVFNPYAGGLQLNYEENPEWFYWGWWRDQNFSNWQK